MIRIFIAIATLAIGACTQPQGGAHCNVTVTSEIAFTSPEAQDSITANTMGPSCDKAIGLYTVRDADGHPIWSWSSPLPRAFGEISPHNDADEVRVFLERWAEPRIATTQTLPEWPHLPHGQTTLDQDTYNDIRARDLPMLCHYSGTAREICVFWEPAAGGAGLLFERDVPEETNP